MKTVIFTMTTTVCNLISDDVNNFWGIGDMIRGICCVYNICKKLNYTFILDIQHHPIALYLKKNEHIYTDFISKNKHTIPFIFPNKSENYIVSNKEDIIFFVTNDIYNGEADEKCKTLLRNLFEPNEVFQQFINEKIANINLKEFSIIHFRLGDEYLVQKKINMKLIEKCYELFKTHREEKQILLTDNDYFKDLLKTKENVMTFDTKSVHLGYKGHKNNIQETLFEFIVVLSVKKIKHFNVYDWTSGFVNAAKIINSANLIKIN